MADRRGDLRHSLFKLAAEQAGYFSAAQAKDLGYSYQAQAHHLQAGNWLRVERGVFRFVDWVPGLHDELAMCDAVVQGSGRDFARKRNVGSRDR